MISAMRVHGLAVLLAAALTALPMDRPQAGQNIALNLGDPTPATGQQAEDQKVVDDAFATAQSGGLVALQPRIQTLETVLGHAPRSFPIVEQAGDTIMVRADTDDEYVTLSLVAGVDAGKGKGGRGKSISVVRAPNTYPQAALALGAYFDEIGDYTTAMRFLDQGLAMQPDSPLLLIEKGACLAGQRRFADAVALYDAALSPTRLALLGKRSQLLRNRGVALIDLGRLDEAEKALKDSIDGDKSDTVGVERANHELAYIANLRRGGTRIGIVLKNRIPAPDANSGTPTSQPH